MIDAKEYITTIRHIIVNAPSMEAAADEVDAFNMKVANSDSGLFAALSNKCAPLFLGCI